MKKISSRYILIICISLIIISVILFYSIFDQAYHSNAAWAYAYLWVKITLISSSIAIILLVYEMLCFMFTIIKLKRLLISFFIISFTLLINIYIIPYIFNHLNTISLDKFLSLNGTKYRIISITNQDNNENPSIELYLKDIQMKETEDIIGFVQDFSLVHYKRNYQSFDQLFAGKEQLMFEFFSKVDAIGKFNIVLKKKSLKISEHSSSDFEYFAKIGVEEKYDSIVCISIIWDYPDRVPIDTCVVFKEAGKASIKEDLPLNTPSLKGVRTME